jgi:two-component system CheB/CheR fusion protein
MITEVNPYLIEMLGYTRDQIIKKTIWEIGFFNDLVANKDKFLELQQKEFVRYENLPLEAADGRKIEVEFISSIYSVENIKVIQCQIRELLACCNKNAD